MTKKKKDFKKWTESLKQGIFSEKYHFKKVKQII